MIEYGNIIKIVSSEDYDNQLFFVKRVASDKLTLLKANGKEVTIPVDKIKEIIIVYVPEEKGFVNQSHLSVGEWVEIEFKSKTKDVVQGRIIKIDKNLHVETSNGMYYIPIEYGLPENVISVREILEKEEEEEEVKGAQPDVETQEAEEKEEEKEEPEEMVEPDEVIEEEVLGSIEVEEGQENLFFTLEQQKIDLLEHLLINVEESKRSVFLMKKMYNIIQRYKELKTIYTSFEDGVKVIRLPQNQYQESFIKNVNPLFVPVSDKVKIKVFDLLVDIGTRKSFYYITSDIYENIFKDPQFKNISFSDYQKELLKPFNSLVTETNYDKHEIMNKRKEVYLLKELLKIPISESFVSDSVIVQPRVYLHYSLRDQQNSNILLKSNLSRNPYYELMFRKEDDINVVNVDDSYKASCELFNNEITWYKNDCATYEEYVQKLLPSFEDFINCYLNTKFLNFSQVLKEMETLKIEKLNKTTYDILFAILKKNINDFYRTELENRKLNTREKKQPPILKDMTVIGALLRDYYPLKHDYFYSISEVFKSGLIDCYHYYALQTTHQNVRILDSEIEQMIESIKKEFENPQKDRVHKIYETEQQLKNDENKIVLQDIPWEKAFISAGELLHRELVKRNSMLSLDDVIIKLKKVCENNIDQIKNQFDKNDVQFIKEFITKYHVLKNQKAEVLETKKIFIWNGSAWKLSTEEAGCLAKNLVRIKGECQEVNKEKAFKERISEMINNFETDKLREKELKKVKIDDESHLSRLRSLQMRHLKSEMKYHTEKYNYRTLELQKDNIPQDISPYLDLRGRILKEPVLSNKYKALQLFIKNYTKTGEDPHWFYCIESNVKLLPTFLLELSDAFLKTNTYPETLQMICDRQGELSDNFDYYVDKYSGYPIKAINFDDEEDYNSGGFKDVFHEVVEKEEEFVEENPKDKMVKNAINALLSYSGILIEKKYTDELFELVMKSVSLTLSTGKSKNENSIIVYAVMAHCFIFIQTLAGDVKFSKPFPNCVKSFEGYPLDAEDKGYKGIKYMCCIVKEISRKTDPWESVKGTKMEVMIETLANYTKQFVLPIKEINDKLITKREVKVEIKEHTEEYSWSLFYPRLNIVKPIQVLSESPFEKIMALSFIIQSKINAHISKQSAILTNSLKQPYLINTCCQKNNDVFQYMLENAKLTELDEVFDIKRKMDKKNEMQKINHMYCAVPTKMMHRNVSASYEESVIYRGVIRWFMFDTELPFPEKLKKYGIVKPPDYNKKDKIGEKIAKIKNFKPVPEEVFIEIIKDISHKIERTIVEKVHKVSVKNQMDEWIKDNKVKEVYNFCGEETNKKIINILSQIPKADKKRTDACLRFNTLFRNNKKNDFLPENLEHLNFMNHILLNKIKSLLFIFPEKIKNSKTNYSIPKHWDLDKKHIMEIKQNIFNYYRTIETFHKNEDLIFNLNKLNSESDYDDFKRWISLPIHNQKMKNDIYYYIFVSIFEHYILLKSPKMNEYIKVVVAHFVSEDSSALNFDSQKIEYISDMAKKSETQIKTDALKNLSREARKAQNTLKELKLGEWNTGLSKSIFKYDKSLYNEVFEEAKKIREGMDLVDEDNYGTYGLDDGENVEGFDGDEYY
jgi:hypothetical protein